MSELDKLMKALQSLYHQYGGDTVATQAATCLYEEGRRKLIAQLIDGVDQDTQLEAAKDILAKLDSGHRDILVAHVLYGYDPDPTSPTTGLPQKLRGAVHALTQRYQPNLVVDAAMLAMPEEQRAAVARCFLPEKAETEKQLKYTYVNEGFSELFKAADVESSFRFRDASGRVTTYQFVETLPEYGPDGTLIRTVVRYREGAAQ